jgi:Mg-chelatase subunit ChlD/pimeloyl-ACP methyl ester carboxylesterase
MIRKPHHRNRLRTAIASVAVLSVALSEPSNLAAQPAAATPPIPLPPPAPTSPWPTSTADPGCRPPAPTRNVERQTRYKVLFVSGFAPGNLFSVVPQSHWNYIRQHLINAGRATADLDLKEEDFLYFSYSGNYECVRGFKDYTRPRYTGADTWLSTDVLESFLLRYPKFGETFEEILAAYPDDRFVIVSHSLGGVVATYWAATRPISPVPIDLDRVDTIITVGSPLRGWPGFCNLKLPMIPSLVLDELPNAPSKVNVLTIANRRDTVVSADKASLPNVWRQLEDDIGDDYVSGIFCDLDGHGVVLQEFVVAAEIASAIWPAHVLRPRESDPITAGNSSQPTAIDIDITWPRSNELVDQLKANQTGNVVVTIGGSLAQVMGVSDRTSELQSNRFASPFRRRFRLRALPKPQARGGSYDLTVAVGQETHTQVRAVQLAEAPPSPPGGSTTVTLLTFDVSGSMAEADSSGISKIEAAREAGRRIARVIAAENQRQPGMHRLGVVAFSDEADVIQGVDGDEAGIEPAIAQLSSGGGTNMAAGLQLAAQQLRPVAGVGRKIAILLSDGQPTVGLGSGRELRQEIREVVLPELRNAADCVYVVGLGDSSSPTDLLSALLPVGSIDEPFLREIAATTGCGGYYNAATADELAATFLRLRHVSTGQLISDVSATIRQGETTPPQLLAVPTGTQELLMTLDWPGSRLDLWLTDPLGRRVDGSYPGAALILGLPPVQAIIQSPVPGTWQAQVHGADVPEGTAAYSLLASTRTGAQPALPTAMPGSAAWVPTGRSGGANQALLAILVIVALFGTGAALYYVADHIPQPAMSRFAAPARPPMPSSRVAALGTLTVLAHGGRSRTIPLDRSQFTIGREPSCALALSDPLASHVHARILRHEGAVVLEDLGSTNGTRVNGRTVRRHPLQSGDVIEIGSTRLRYTAAGGLPVAR